MAGEGATQKTVGSRLSWRGRGRMRAGGST